jgi:hypothetical protein
VVKGERVTLTRLYELERRTKRFARYRQRTAEGAEPDTSVLYVALDALGDPSPEIEMTLTPRTPVPSAPTQEDQAA